MIAHGDDTETWWRLIAQGMRPDAVDFLARCFAGQLAASTAKDSMRMRQREKSQRTSIL